MSDSNAPAGGDASAPEGRRCGRCGAINTRADAVICSTCGALLAAYDAPVGVDTDADPTPPPLQAEPSAEPASAISESAEPQPDIAATPDEPATPPPPDQPNTAPSIEEDRPRTIGTAPSTPTMPARPSLPSRPTIEPVPTVARPASSTTNSAPATPPPTAQPSPPQASPSTPPRAQPSQSPPAPPAQTTQPRPPRPAQTAPSQPPRRPAAPPPQEAYPDEPPDDTPSPAELREAEAIERVRARPVTPGQWPPRVEAGAYGAGGFLARQVPQTWIIAGIVGLFAVCILSMVISAIGGDTAAGFLIICVGPLALLALGIGIALLVTRGRRNW